MTGQDAVNTAKHFNERLELDGLILTKFDSDTRGGAALSAKTITGKPIKFIGVGEKFENLEPFHADRMAGRILGMGDIVSLVEQAQENIEQEKAEAMAEKLFTATFTLDDMLEQFSMLEKMGNLKDLMAKIPGIGAQLADQDLDEGGIKRMRAIIQSMTPKERYHPDMIDGQRRRRIARWSGTQVGDVNELLKEFKNVRKMMKDMGKQGGFMQKIAGGRMKKMKKKKWQEMKGKKKSFDMKRFLRGE